ncbi:MAG: hypothetical protein WCP32_04215 [Bacteroidota bacterium]
MALSKGKHNIVEIEGVRCTLVETGVSPERMEFLKNLLVFNRYEVKSEPVKAKDGSILNSFVIGVTDILFNPMIAVYQKKLFTPDGETVSPAFWNQWIFQENIPYWQVKL